LLHKVTTGFDSGMYIAGKMLWLFQSQWMLAALGCCGRPGSCQSAIVDLPLSVGCSSCSLITGPRRNTAGEQKFIFLLLVGQ